MNATLKPRPTEYLGILFRSKSEAMFARWIDSMGVQWDYEPEALRVGEWRPDFVMQPNASQGEIQIFVVEYKPRLPTKAYLGDFSGRFAALSEKNSLFKMEAIVACVDWFSDSENTLLALMPDGTFGEQVVEWLPNERQKEKVRQFRFDLKSE